MFAYDMDGTLCFNAEREALVRQHTNFHLLDIETKRQIMSPESVLYDKPTAFARHTLPRLDAIVVISNRPWWLQEATRQWFRRHAPHIQRVVVNLCPESWLELSAAEYKLRMLDKLQLSGIFDDREDVVMAVRQSGRIGIHVA